MKLPWVFKQKFLCKRILSFSLGKSQGVELMGNMGSIDLTLWEPRKLFSKVVVPFNLCTNQVWAFQLLYILDIHCLIYISLMTNDVEYILLLIGYLHIFYCEVHALVFFILVELYKFFIFFRYKPLVKCMYCKYILSIWDHLWILLKERFHEQKFLFLM